MSNGPTSDPIFPDQQVVTPPAGHPVHEKHHDRDTEWVVIHRGGAGSKAHVEALERHLLKADIAARVEHDDEHRVVLEVHRADEHEAKQIIGSAEVSGEGEKPHQTSEERIEAEEKAELKGPFKAATMTWVLIVVAIAVAGLLVFWMYPR